MNLEPEAPESVETLLAFTVDKRQRNAEAASPELRKEALLSATVRKAHQRRRSSAPCKAFFSPADELIEVDDSPDSLISRKASEESSAEGDKVPQEQENLQKMSELLKEITVISNSPRSKRKRLYEDQGDLHIFSKDDSLLSSPCKIPRGKSTAEIVPEPHSLMET